MAGESYPQHLVEGGTALSSCFTLQPAILALEQESKIHGCCWALSEFHIFSRSFSNQFLSTVFVFWATPTNWIEGK